MKTLGNGGDEPSDEQVQNEVQSLPQGAAAEHHGLRVQGLPLQTRPVFQYPRICPEGGIAAICDETWCPYVHVYRRIWDTVKPSEREEPAIRDRVEQLPPTLPNVSLARLAGDGTSEIAPAARGEAFNPEVNVPPKRAEAHHLPPPAGKTR